MKIAHLLEVLTEREKILMKHSILLIKNQILIFLTVEELKEISFIILRCSDIVIIEKSFNIISYGWEELTKRAIEKNLAIFNF